MPRSQLPTLLGLILLAAAATYLLNRTRPLGRNVGASPAAMQVLEDRTSAEASDGDANLTIVVFTDYRCSACRQAAPALEAAIARDGNVRVVYKEWPIFGEDSERAAKAALAAERQGVFPRLHYELMKSGSFDDAALRAAVEKAGGDWQQIEADLRTHGEAIENQIAANRADAFALGLQGTPGYLIGPILVEGALTEREFLRTFEQARSER